MLIDYREPKRLKEMLADIGKEAELVRGDYFFFSADDLSVCIERAAIGDLLSKISSGRLYRQLKGITSFDVPILLIEGVYSPTKDGLIRIPQVELKWNYHSIENILLDAQLRGVILARTPSLEASARLIRGYYHYFSKEDHRFEVKKQRLFTYSAKVTPQLQMVCALPGVNWQLGHRLLDLFGSPLAVFVADEKILQEIDGIGKKKAKVIRETLRQGVNTHPPPPDLPYKAPGKF